MVYFLLIIVVIEAIIIKYLDREVKKWKQITADYKLLLKRWWHEESQERTNKNELH